MTPGRKFGPTRGELIFRLCAGLAGLALLAGIVIFKGAPAGPASFELFGIGGLFFGGTALWAGRRLIKRDHP